MAVEGLVSCPGRELVRPKEGDGSHQGPGDEGGVCRREDPGGPSGLSQVPWAGLDLPPSLATPGAQSTCPSQALPAPSHFFGAPTITPIALFRGAKTSQVSLGNGVISTYR